MKRNGVATSLHYREAQMWSHYIRRKIKIYFGFLSY